MGGYHLIQKMLNSQNVMARSIFAEVFSLSGKIIVADIDINRLLSFFENEYIVHKEKNYQKVHLLIVVNIVNC